LAREAVAGRAGQKFLPGDLPPAQDARAAWRNASRNAVRYAQQTKGLMERLQFADGDQRYVVYRAHGRTA
jgi:hypothetical protein